MSKVATDFSLSNIKQVITFPLNKAYAYANGLSAYFNGISRTMFDNGMQVKVRRDSDTRLMTTRISLRVGAQNDPPGKEGLAHLVEHMVFFRDKEMARQMREEAAKRGGNFMSGMTSQFGTVYEGTILSNKDNAEFSMKTYTKALFDPDFKVDPAELEKEKEVITNEILGELDKKRRVVPLNLSMNMLETAFGLPNTLHDVIGTPESVRSITVEDVENFYRQHYTPANTTVEISGPNAFSNAYPAMKKYMKDIPSEQTEPPVEKAEYQYQGGEHVTENAELDQNHFMVAFNMPNLMSPVKDAQADFLLGYISNAVERKLRGLEERHLYHVQGFWNHYQAHKVAVITGNIKPENAHLVLPAIADVMKDLAAGNIDKELMEIVKGQIKFHNAKRHDFMRKSDNDFSTGMERMGTRYDEWKNIRHMTPKSLTAMVKEHMLAFQPTLVIEGQRGTMQSFNDFKDMLPIKQKPAEAAAVPAAGNPAAVV